MSSQEVAYKNKAWDAEGPLSNVSESHLRPFVKFKKDGLVFKPERLENTGIEKADPLIT